MSQDWYLMTAPNQMSGFENDYFTDYATESFNEILSTFVGEDVTIYNSTLTDSNIVKGIVQGKDKKNEKQILLPLNSSHMGMYIKYKDLYWLITELVNDNKMYQTALVTACNYLLPFQSTDGTILSYPCVDSANSSIGLDANNTITTLNGIHHIKLPFDSNTKLIKVDRRFFLDSVGTITCKVTNVNNTTYLYGDKGLIELTVQQEGAYNSTTDKNGVCDYFIPTTPTPLPTTGYSMSVSANGKLIVGGSTRTFTPKLIDSDGVLQTFVGVWSINYNGMNMSDFTITYSGNNCLVSVKENYDFIGKTLVLTCTTDDELYSAVYSAVITA